MGGGSATGGTGAQRKQGLDGSPPGHRQVVLGSVEAVRVPAWAEDFGGTGFHVERVTGRLSLTFLCVCLK